MILDIVYGKYQTYIDIGCNKTTKDLINILRKSLSKKILYLHCNGSIKPCSDKRIITVFKPRDVIYCLNSYRIEGKPTDKTISYEDTIKDIIYKSN